MKTLKSALLGNRPLTGANSEELLLQMKIVIKEHRSVLIDRLIKDLPTYVGYKFEGKLSKEVLMKMKEALYYLRDGEVDLQSYDKAVKQLSDHAVILLTNEPCYKEIDKCLTAFTTKDRKIIVEL